MLCAVEKVWGPEGVETPVIPDEPDVFDANDALEWLEVDALASGCRVVSGRC